MRVFDALVLVVLLGVMSWGMYTVWQKVPTSTPLAYSAFAANVSQDLPAQSYQFYPNMRYQNRTITYIMEPACTAKKRQDIARALAILEENTILQFVQSDTAPEIKYICSELPAPSNSTDHFVAGEGGPTSIINTTRYVVILSGKVSLYRTEKCELPVLALHETLHALGFDHTRDTKSIMFPISDCQQQLDSFIIQQLREVYAADTLPDLTIEQVTANARGHLLAFDINVSNYGLADVTNASLIINANGVVSKTFPLAEIKMGKRRTLSARNIQLSTEAQTLEFIVTANPPGAEIDLANNHALLHLVPQNTTTTA